MAIEGWYYLHENGDMIYKRELGGTDADIRESSFAKMLWPFDPNDRAGAWRIVVEGLACGATKERITELAEKWGCNDEDAKKYAEYLGAILQMDAISWCATRGDFINLQESSAGFGDTALEALADLCGNLEFRPSKMWGTTFADLIR